MKQNNDKIIWISDLKKKDTVVCNSDLLALCSPESRQFSAQHSKWCSYDSVNESSRKDLNYITHILTGTEISCLPGRWLCLCCESSSARKRMKKLQSQSPWVWMMNHSLVTLSKLFHSVSSYKLSQNSS